MEIKKVKGEDKGEVMLYALSTCGWCRKTKELLNSMGVEYSFVDVDLVPGPDKDVVMNQVKTWNPACSFPTLVINKKCIVGYKDDQIKAALSK